MWNPPRIWQSGSMVLGWSLRVRTDSSTYEEYQTLFVGGKYRWKNMKAEKNKKQKKTKKRHEFKRNNLTWKQEEIMCGLVTA